MGLVFGTNHRQTRGKKGGGSLGGANAEDEAVRLNIETEGL
jgi:hypothetical protein